MHGRRGGQAGTVGSSGAGAAATDEAHHQGRHESRHGGSGTAMPPPSGPSGPSSATGRTIQMKVRQRPAAPFGRGSRGCRPHHDDASHPQCPAFSGHTARSRPTCHTRRVTTMNGSLGRICTRAHSTAAVLVAISRGALPRRACRGTDIDPQHRLVAAFTVLAQAFCPRPLEAPACAGSPQCNSARSPTGRRCAGPTGDAISAPTPTGSRPPRSGPARRTARIVDRFLFPQVAANFPAGSRWIATGLGRFNNILGIQHAERGGRYLHHPPCRQRFGNCE